MLDTSLLSQLKDIFATIDSDFEFVAELDSTTSDGKEMLEFLQEFCTTSPHFYLIVNDNEKDKLQFSIRIDSKPTGIYFRGIPSGHEFNTLLLAVLNADGKGKNLPDKNLQRRIAAIKGEVKITTYVSLTCTNCPDVAQALNLIALYNPGISNFITDGGKFQKEVEELGIQAVPTVYANGELLSVGRATLPELLGKLEERFGTEPVPFDEEPIVRDFDVLIVGGGPAGVAAGIYSARKGLKTAIVAGEAGGSVNLTESIENLITTQLTTGKALASTLRDNAVHYGVELFEGRTVEKVETTGELKSATAIGGETFRAPAMIISTGSSPRRLGIPGENEYTGRGVAFCPHCDGPMFRGKDVAVIGGGNAGIEAAIDLAGICKKVVVYEFLDVLKADQVLIDKANSLPNVEIFTSRQITEITGDGNKATGVVVKDRATGESSHVDFAGIFIQIGTIPCSKLFEGQVEINPRGEIVTDRNCRTSVPGVYAAGDVANGPYKQIVTAIGEGAIAAMTAFDDSIRK